MSANTELITHHAVIDECRTMAASISMDRYHLFDTPLQQREDSASAKVLQETTSVRSPGGRLRHKTAAGGWTSASVKVDRFFLTTGRE